MQFWKKNITAITALFQFAGDHVDKPDGYWDNGHHSQSVFNEDSDMIS